MSGLTADIEDPTSGELRDLAAVGLLKIMDWDDDTATREANGLLQAHERKIRVDERRRIAEEIRVEMRRHDTAQTGFSAIGDAYANAARIAERGGQ